MTTSITDDYGKGLMQHVGSYDGMPEAKQMEAINLFMVFYYGAVKWLKERHPERPGI